MTDALQSARTALADRPAWLVGGAIRDRLLGRETSDLDLVVDGDPSEAARAIARAAGRAACFALSEEFGAWRVSARDSSWQVDVEPLRGGSLEADLALRDFTVNAIAEPLRGGAPIDPTGGIADLSAKRLRMVAASAFAEDPLRVLRLVRVSVELELEPEPDTLRHAREHARELARCSPERVFVELRRTIGSREPLRGLELLSQLGATAVVLPELEALRGVEQNRFHHADVYDHTIEVLARTVALERFVADAMLSDDELAVALADRREEVSALLREPLADGLTRGEALRWGALLHDAAKPLTRGVRPLDGRVTFLGHDERGASLAREVLGRLRTSERLRAHVAALALHHLRLGFLVHERQPLSRRIVFSYLRATDPVEVDVTLLSIADRLATRGDRAQAAIAAHLLVARGMLDDALDWRASGPQQPLLRGDELGSHLGIAPGPQIGAVLADLAAAQYAGEVSTREQAFAYAQARAEDDSARSE
ncbi:MAG TPA: HD domain-containing protein [Solirubrobacteraceae bacterium]|nr:HD domain-containing protein [Solirubrobacteraceae bacterium]